MNEKARKRRAEYKREYNKRYRQEHQEQYNEYQREYQRKYRAEHPEKIQAILIKHWKNQLKGELTPYIDYNPMREALNYREWEIVLDALHAYAETEPFSNDVINSILSGLYPYSEEKS